MTGCRLLRKHRSTNDMSMYGKPTDITTQGTNCTCARAEKRDIKAQTVRVHVRKTHRHHYTEHKLYLWMCGKPRHHHTRHKLYLCMCGKPTDITTQGTNCTCGCTENLQASPHRAQTVPVHVRKTQTLLHRAQTVTVDGRKTHIHHHTGQKLNLWTCGRLGLPRVRPARLVTKLFCW
jgi:hypothetical protein